MNVASVVVVIHASVNPVIAVNVIEDEVHEKNKVIRSNEE